jgi:hypothetical protein
MKLFGQVCLGVVGLVLFLSLCFGMEWAGIAWTGFFGPKRAAVQREVFENTASYVKGTENDIAKYRREYMQTDDASSRQSIVEFVAGQYAEFDANKLENPKNREFLSAIQDGEYIVPPSQY